MTALSHARLADPARDLDRRIAAAAARTRQLAIAGIYRAGSGHPGGALSCADLLAALYVSELNIPGGTATDPARDRFVLSKGHAAPALYAAWAAIGYVPDAIPLALRRIGTKAQGHPHVLDLLAGNGTGAAEEAGLQHRMLAYDCTEGSSKQAAITMVHMKQ